MERKIYLKTEAIKLGAGSTQRVTTVENYYQVLEKDEDHVTVRLLDFEDRPFGPPEVIHKDKLKDFIYCPDYFKNKKVGKELTADRHVQAGDRHLEKKEFLSAEFEYDKAISINQDHLKANLGKGKALYAMGKKEEAKKVFSRISQIESLYDKENKHIFNEVGIELRQKGMMEEATTNYIKALSIDPMDEVLFYNLGRAYYEQGEIEKAIEQLRSALKLKPDFDAAMEFLTKIEPVPPASQPRPAKFAG